MKLYLIENELQSTIYVIANNLKEAIDKYENKYGNEFGNEIRNIKLISKNIIMGD